MPNDPQSDTEVQAAILRWRERAQAQQQAMWERGKDTYRAELLEHAEATRRSRRR